METGVCRRAPAAAVHIELSGPFKNGAEKQGLWKKQMKYRYLEKAYYPGSYSLIPMEPGDEWVVEGIVRFHLPAILIDMEKKPESFTYGEISVADYAPQLEEHRPRSFVPEEIIGEEEEGLSDPVVLVEYGPDNWCLIDGWERIDLAVQNGISHLPAVKLASEQAMQYLVDEADVRRYIEYWNYRTAYWERHDRINGLLAQDLPEFTVRCPDADATWDAICQAAAGREVELPIRWNRWFSMHGDGSHLYIGEARHMAPLCALTFDRPVRRKEFMEVFPLYEEWESAADEEPIRAQARRMTISYEYIFSMIRQFASEKKCDTLVQSPQTESEGPAVRDTEEK